MDTQQFIDLLIEYGPEIIGTLAAGIITETWAGFSKRFPKYRGLIRRILRK